MTDELPPPQPSLQRQSSRPDDLDVPKLVRQSSREFLEQHHACLICHGQFPLADCYTTTCNHNFNKTCLTSAVDADVSQILASGSGVPRCPHCSVALSLHDVRCVLREEDQWRLLKVIKDSWVATQPHLESKENDVAETILNTMIARRQASANELTQFTLQDSLSIVNNAVLVKLGQELDEKQSETDWQAWFDEDPARYISRIHYILEALAHTRSRKYVISEEEQSKAREDFSANWQENDMDYGDYGGGSAEYLPSGLGYGGGKNDRVSAEAFAIVLADADVRDIYYAALYQTLNYCLTRPVFVGAVHPVAYAVLLLSPLSSWLGEYFRTTSMVEVGKRSTLYFALFVLAQTLVGHPDWVALLRPDGTTAEVSFLVPVSRPSSFPQFAKLKKAADLFSLAHAKTRQITEERLKKAADAANNNPNQPAPDNSSKKSKKKKGAASPSGNINAAQQLEALQKEAEEDSRQEQTLLTILDLIPQVAQLAGVQGKTFVSSRIVRVAAAASEPRQEAKSEEPAVVEEKKAESEAAAPAVEGEEAEKAAKLAEIRRLKEQVRVLEGEEKAQRQVGLEVLKSLQFQTMDLLSDSVPMRHYYKSQAESDAGQPFARGRLSRIRQEMSSLMDNLPEGIYVRIDEERFDVMRVLMQGPFETPYQNGLFLFDVYLPPQYPQKPPLVKFLTTGDNSFRFNPNLYSEGKVCLSLLGTWDGPGWDPNISTLLQVFISIQAMILNETPIVNEPGWETYHTDESEQWREHIYNQAIRHGTLLYATLWQLKRLPYGFESVIKTHFWLKRHELQWQIADWSYIDMAKMTGYDGVDRYRDQNGDWHYEDSVVTQLSFTETCQQIKAMLAELPVPEMTE
eukprot:TRINITY_DN1346_c0_g1_i3.p1 TRINITY_DN1346_c0_g1~~TRINITY_DN1346_c0_g1_i3.p1  ORF type:complete len:880 (+),score=339.29 TRINITY_DN1346_c0_g1_i3:69-2642(+)